MRIIAGKYKGRRLKFSKALNYRPTLDRVRESIFNILGYDLIDAIALDLFCGTGSLGLETLSRGALRVTFVENNKPVLKLLNQNIKTLETERKSRVICKDVFQYLKQQTNIKFDIVFADPPYDDCHGSELCRLLSENGILKPGGIFILERFKKDIPDCDNYQILKTLKFGQTEVDFLRLET